MNGDAVWGLVWTVLAASGMLLSLGFGYLYRKDRDKRKLMFMVATFLASFRYLPMIQTVGEGMLILRRVKYWSALPVTWAVLFAVLSNFLRQRDFDKPFRAFLFILALTIFVIIVPLPLSAEPFFLPAVIGAVGVSIYIYMTRRETSVLMLLISLVCFALSGIFIEFDLEELAALKAALAYIFMVLAFATARETIGEGISSIFALKKELRETQEELRISQEQLVRAERLAAIGQVAAMVGHDLRNPLQCIENATYNIRNDLQRVSTSVPILQETMEMLQVIDDSVNYADKIIRDLEDFSRTKKPVLEKANLNTLLEETLSHAEVPDNVHVSTELGYLTEVEVDKEQMKRVFLNLIMNGVQAMEKGGRLIVSSRKAGSLVEVSIEDTGIGISNENMKNLFIPFFTTKAKGMGLGLAICKKFVEGHGGSIEVESAAGKGTIFTVRLPIEQGAEVKASDKR